MTGISIFLDFSSIVFFVIIPEIPKIRRILKIFDPTTFASAISDFQSKAAMKDVVSSGILVPIATTVKPITALDSFIFFAKITAESTNQLAPNPKIINPIIKYK